MSSPTARWDDKNMSIGTLFDFGSIVKPVVINVLSVIVMHYPIV